MRRILVFTAAVLALGACDDSTGPGTGAQVSVDFVASPTSGASMSLMGVGGASLAAIDVSGTNGVLSLETAHVIVSEFELERTESTAGCGDVSMGDDLDDDDCEEIERGPLFVELPLDAGETTTLEGEVQPGSYDEIEFEIEDLEDDEEGDDAQRIAALLTEVREQYPSWPREASMRVAGTFTPAGATEAIPFVVYLEAEIEIEMEFDSPFVVTEADVSRTVTVELDPRDWFARPDGTVLDLTAYDYETTGQVLEFEVEIEDGFKHADHDD